MLSSGVISAEPERKVLRKPSTRRSSALPLAGEKFAAGRWERVVGVEVGLLQHVRS